MDHILQLEHVSKRYGDHLAVDDLSFAVPRGSVFGLLGPNGAGKSTTIRMIMRVITQDSGSILLDGREVDDDRRRLIGYLPEERGLYRKMKVLEHLVFLGTLRGLRPAEGKRRGSAWLERFKLGDWATHKVEDLSKGMQQKVQFIGTILHRPQLVILDEPFAGLDPINARELKDLLLAMSVEGVTVVLSTHVLPQVDELCSHICLINRARPILVGALAEIRERFGGNAWTVRSDLDQERARRSPWGHGGQSAQGGQPARAGGGRVTARADPRPGRTGRARELHPLRARSREHLPAGGRGGQPCRVACRPRQRGACICHLFDAPPSST